MIKSLKLIKAAFLSSALMILAACQHTSGGTAKAPEMMRNTIQMVRLPLEIPQEADGTDSLSNIAVSRINSFLTSIEAGYGDILMLDTTDVSPERVTAIETLIRARGLVYAGVGAFGNAPKSGHAVLYVERYLVTPPKCNYWPEESSVNDRNNDSPFHGCANTINLGMMVADPRDLIAGRSSGNSTRAAVNAISPAQPGAGALTPATIFQQMFEALPAQQQPSSSSTGSGQQ